MLVKSRIALSSVTLIIALLFAGCTSGVSDSDIAAQVTSYLKNDIRDGIMSRVAFSKFFEVTNVSVKDKLIKEKEMTVICNVTISVTKKYHGNSGVTMAYDFVVGDGPGTAGQTKASDVKFMFEKYESGWQIKGETR